MPWFKVDDQLSFHAKVVAAGNAAMGLWVRAGAWSAGTLSEGFVPDSIVSALGGTKSARALVVVGLWERSEGGYAFRDWSSYQPSKESVELARDAARVRQQRARDKARREREARQEQDVTSNDDGSHGASHGVTDALVTVPPSQPSPSSLSSKESGARKRGTRLPVGWIPDDRVRTAMMAEYPQLDFRREHANFTDHFLAAPGQKGVKVDWNATWRKWIRTSATEYAPRRNQPEQLPTSKPWTPPPPPAEIADDTAACDAWYRQKTAEHYAQQEAS